MSEESSFSSRLGYILAASGSAVGLGNIWRFPYCAAKFGGGIFLLIYIILVVTFGYSLIITETNLGRMTGCGPIGAFRNSCKGHDSFLGKLVVGGYINALVPVIITPYYCVIGGWVCKYVVAMLCNPISKFSKDALVTLEDGSTIAASNHYFNSFITSTAEPIIYLLFFAAFLAVIVAFGIKKGIERFNKVLMPMLALMCVALCIYSCTLPGASAGIKYYLAPDTNKFSYMTVVSAMGQMFFSLSLGMGIAITYGSYMRKQDNLVANVNQVLIFDTVIAMMAGLMIIPPVVAFGGESAALNAGPGLIFCILPQVFASFPGGHVCAVVFFVLVLFAAATSAISLLETNVQTFCQELGIDRRKSIVVGVVEIVVVGTLTALGYSALSNVHPLAFIEAYKGMQILDCMDFISNNVLMPIAAIFTTVLVVAVVGLRGFCQNVAETVPHWRGKAVFQFCMCMLVVPCLLVVLLDAVGILK